MTARTKTATTTIKATRMERGPPSRHLALQLELDRPAGRNGFPEGSFQRIGVNGRDGRSLLGLVLGCLPSPLRGRFREEGALRLLVHLQGVAPRDVGRVVVGHDDR